MKKVTVIVVVALVTFIALMLPSFGKQYQEENADREVCIAWETVNLREDYSTGSDIIAELHQGTKVTLTGHSYEYVSAENTSTESWKQVRTESGLTGWIVTQSIKWH